MPKITQYDAPEGIGLRPTETGISAVAGAARRLQGDYSEAAAAQAGTGHRLGSAISTAGEVAVKYIEHQEISHGALGLAGLIEAKSKQWDDIQKSADPNDPTVAKKFLAEDLEPDLEKFKTKGFLTEGGQKWAESHVDQFRQHMFHKTSADMTRLAGEAEVVNIRQTTNKLSNTARNDGTQAGMDFALKNFETSIGASIDSHTNLSGAVVSKLKTDVMQKGKEEIVNGTALGAIEKTGKIPEWASDPKYSKYLDFGDLTKAARFYESQRKSEEHAVQVKAEHDARLKLNTEITKLDLTTTDDHGQPVVGPEHYKRLNEIVQQNDLGVSLEPGLIHRQKNTLDNLLKQHGKKEPTAQISNETQMNLFAEVRSGKLDDYEMMERIDDAYGNGKLTWAARNNLTKEVEDKKTPLGRARQEYFTNRFGPSMDGGMSGNTHSLLGKQRLADAMDDAREQEKALRAAGVPVRELYNPKSEHYFDKDGAARAKYSVSMGEALNYQASIGTDKTAPGGVGKAQGQDMKNPIPLPAGVKTAVQIKALGIQPGTWVKFDNGDIGRLQ